MGKRINHSADDARWGRCMCADCLDQEIACLPGDSRRYIITRWSDDSAQWTSSDITQWARRGVGQGYRYSVSRTLKGLLGVGIRTYPTRARAREALRRIERSNNAE